MITSRKRDLGSIPFALLIASVFVLLLQACDDNPAAIQDDLLEASNRAVEAAVEAQGDILIEIEKHAQLSFDGAVITRIRISCDPLPGTEDFQEAIASVVQAKTGTDGEAGIDGAVVCDGVERMHTARTSPTSDDAFRRGPAIAGAFLIVCNLTDNDQVCAEGATQRRIIIAGRLVP